MNSRIFPSQGGASIRSHRRIFIGRTISGSDFSRANSNSRRNSNKKTSLSTYEEVFTINGKEIVVKSRSRLFSSDGNGTLFPMQNKKSDDKLNFIMENFHPDKQGKLTNMNHMQVDKQNKMHE